MAADGASITGVNFRKVMSVLPSSITLTNLNSSVGTVVVDYITRFGFAVYASRASTGLFFFEGTYTTVGN